MFLTRKSNKINPFPAMLSYSNVHPPEPVHRYCDPQLQMGEKLLIFAYFESKNLPILMFKH